MSTRVFNAKFWLNSKVSKIERLLLDCLAAAGDDDGDIIKNIYLSNQSIAEATNMSCRSVIRTCFSLEEKGILQLVTSKVNANERFIISMNDLARYLRPGFAYEWQEKNGRREKVIHRQVTECHLEKKEEVTLCPPEVTDCHQQVTLCPIEVTECHTTLSLPFAYPLNNSLEKSYFLNNEFKIQNLDHAKELISEKVDLLEANKELAIKYAKSSLATEVLFHLEQHSQTEWSKQFNICIDLIKKQTWDIPTKLKIQRMNEAEAREQAAKLAKAQELKEIRASKVTHMVFGDDRSSRTTAQLQIQEMMRSLRHG